MQETETDSLVARAHNNHTGRDMTVWDQSDPTKPAKLYQFTVPESTLVDISSLDPLDKVREPRLYEDVKSSFKSNGLYNPLIVLDMDAEEWLADTELDKDMLPPPRTTGRCLRVQVGNNRYWLLKDLGYHMVECVIFKDKWAAYTLGHLLRVDKKWRRDSGWAKNS